MTGPYPAGPDGPQCFPGRRPCGGGGGGYGAVPASPPPSPREHPMTPENPVERAKEAAGKIKDKAAELLSPTAPGTPGSAPASLEEPAQPREPLPPKADQAAPQARTAT